MLVWAVWCYPDTCLELLKVIWSWAVFPDVAYLLLGLSVNVDALQDIGGTSLAAYMQLCDVLAKDVLEESEGRLGKWEAFLWRLWYVC